MIFINYTLGEITIAFRMKNLLCVRCKGNSTRSCENNKENDYEDLKTNRWRKLNEYSKNSLRLQGISFFGKYRRIRWAVETRII